MPDKDTKFLLCIEVAAVIAAIIVPAIVRAVPSFLANPAWSCADIWCVVKDLQTSMGGTVAGILAFVGILLGFRANRERDQRLRDQEARALASALYGELEAAGATIGAFIDKTEYDLKLAEADKFEWIDLTTAAGPRISTKIYDANAGKLGLLAEPLVRKNSFAANVDKLGILTEPLVREIEPKEQLIVEIVFIFENCLCEYARFAEEGKLVTYRSLFDRWIELAPVLKNSMADIRDTMTILKGYIDNGLPGAVEVARRVVPKRDERLAKFGNEQGYNQQTPDEGEPEN